MIETISGVLDVPQKLLDESENRHSTAANILTQIEAIAKSNPILPTEKFAVQSKNVALLSFNNLKLTNLTVFASRGPSSSVSNKQKPSIDRSNVSVTRLHTKVGMEDYRNVTQRSIAMMFLPAKIFADYDHISAVIFSNSRLFVSKQDKSKVLDHTLPHALKVVSPVLSVEVGKRSFPRLAKNVTIAFRMPSDYQKNGTIHCRFWKKGTIYVMKII